MGWKKGDKGWIIGVLLELNQPLDIVNKEPEWWDAKVLEHHEPKHIGAFVSIRSEWLVPYEERRKR